MTFKTEQEAFWAGSFGDDYIERNQSKELLAANLAFFSKVFAATRDVSSVLEMGANVGMNLRSLSALMPNVSLNAIEINPKAAEQLRKSSFIENVFEGSILEYPVNQKFDLVFTKGVMIHLSPDVLNDVYDKMVALSNRYILVAEYYSPSPTSIPYRGHSDKLFKRDFSGELMDRHPNVRLLDYGFLYRRDQNWPQDDINWFLMEKTSE
ncbi:pseudaminic acid biosynthesis-associated methylase [Thiomicrorhabdus indica]|uniref:pseudaminic acid biosynthesis-associated methylase n=1 Tax=Thiomicrorhabdus indica TaxID=2267253 RepID=UPI00102D98FC|nr:pseudaminic acid biosynthesis-associated methylase [Thiomicrorhabdus indica]